MANLNLDWVKVEKAREAARIISDDTQLYLDQFTTTTVERAICRLYGIDGVDETDVPLPNVVVDHLQQHNVLGHGAAFWLGQAALATGKTPQELAEAVAKGELDLTRLNRKTPLRCNCGRINTPSPRLNASPATAPIAKLSLKNLATSKVLCSMSSLRQVIFTRTSCRPKRLPVRARMSSR